MKTFVLQDACLNWQDQFIMKVVSVRTVYTRNLSFFIIIILCLWTCVNPFYCFYNSAWLLQSRELFILVLIVYLSLQVQ